MTKHLMSKQKEFRYFCPSFSVLFDAISTQNTRRKRAELNCMRERVPNTGKQREVMSRDIYCEGIALGTENPTFHFSCLLPGKLYKYQQVTEWVHAFEKRAMLLMNWRKERYMGRGKTQQLSQHYGNKLSRTTNK